MLIGHNSNYGLNNITIVREEPLYTTPFELNGLVSDDEERLSPDHSYYRHENYVQSTQKVAKQFSNFSPPGNLINSCLREAYSSSNGMTFVHMRRVNKRVGELDSTDEMDSALFMSLTDESEGSDISNHHIWEGRPPLIPYVKVRS